MPFKITVYVGKDGETASLYKPGKLVMYHKNQGKWKVLKEKDFSIKKSWGIRELRKKMQEVIEFMADCNIFVGKSVAGLPYFMLEKIKCNSWEFDGNPTEFLDYILEKEEEAIIEQDAKKKEQIIPGPEEISSGIFEISLKEVQENNTGVTSKQVLLPFLKKGNFYSLAVYCNHIPPWLESYLLTGDLKYYKEKLSFNQVKITLHKKTCYEKSQQN